MQFFKKAQKGFTLIEILVVIGIIAILAAVVIIAINPARQFAQARNSQRQANVESILNALGQNLADNKGVTTCSGIVAATSSIGSPVAPSATPYPVIYIGDCLSAYLPGGVPMDPGTSDNTHLAGTITNTGYTVHTDSNSRYIVCAPNSAYETAISAAPSMICVTR
jgi:prepilin-type N-terminal cleavage/methylation domain-containing protein